MNSEFKIGTKRIGLGYEPYIIAEVGINHNGSLKTALEMIDVAKSAGADAVKFQTFKAEEFCGDPEQQFSYFSAGTEITESMLSMFKRLELKSGDWLKIKEYAVKSEIEFFSTPQNFTDLEVLLPLEINAENINDLSATIGVSFPLRKFKFERELFGSVINFGVQAGRRGAVNNGLVQDNYIKLNLGFTLNDKWYIKRKFD